jgi:hypothetical protein
MPSRHRPKSPQPSSPAAPAAQVQSDVERFAAALKESANADRADRERERQARAEVARKADEAAAHEKALATARRDLERAVESVRQAKQAGRGRAAADEAWKVAKARVIELETGVAPSWAPKPAPEAEADEETSEVAGEGTDAEE